MKAKSLGILSALTASVCCAGPLLLILLGLGGLGFGSVLGKYHGYFILGAGVFLGLGWRSYFQEKTRCHSAHCEMKSKNLTRNILLLASMVVIIFGLLDLYAFAKGSKNCVSCATAVQKTTNKS